MIWIAAAIIIAVVLNLVDRNHKWGAFWSTVEVVAVISAAIFGYILYDNYKMALLFGGSAFMGLWVINVLYDLPRIAGNMGRAWRGDPTATAPLDASQPRTASRVVMPSS